MERGKAGIDSLHKYLLIKYSIDYWSVIDLKIASTREKRGQCPGPHEATFFQRMKTIKFKQITNKII